MNADESLRNVDEKLFDRVWSVMLDLTEQERHFNTLQSNYRTLASTWLLATLAGVGILFSDKMRLPVAPEIVGGCLVTAGAIGIALLWMLDLLIYHEMLVHNDEAAKALEAEYVWLPRVRTRKWREQSWSVRERVSIFYVASIQLLIIIAAACAFNYANAKGDGVRAVTVPAILLLFASAAGLTMQKHVRERHHAKRQGRDGK
jgi:hypothetical protein